MVAIDNYQGTAVVCAPLATGANGCGFSVPTAIVVQPYCAVNRPLFLCRHCYQLPYASQQQSRIDRIIDQKHKLGERIFEHYEYGEGWGKKKGMHWKTFNRLHGRYQSLERQWLQRVATYLDLL